MYTWCAVHFHQFFCSLLLFFFYIHSICWRMSVYVCTLYYMMSGGCVVGYHGNVLHGTIFFPSLDKFCLEESSYMLRWASTKCIWRARYFIFIVRFGWRDTGGKWVRVRVVPSYVVFFFFHVFFITNSLYLYSYFFRISMFLFFSILNFSFHFFL